jgi:hypothetical protein
MKTEFFLEGDKIELAVKNVRWGAYAPARAPVTDGGTAPTHFRTTETALQRCDVVTETALRPS